MITYVITVSRTFPATHPRKGEKTLFVAKITEMLRSTAERQILAPKLHTIRVNYPLWKKRFEKIESGEACLSLRYWSGQPYRSKQIEFAVLTREDGIGIQKITMRREQLQDHVLYGARILDNGDLWPNNLTGENIIQCPVDTYARNDGLTPDDFIAWFAPTFEKALKKYGIFAYYSTAMEMEFAVIHFTKFRY